MSLNAFLEMQKHERLQDVENEASARQAAEQEAGGKAF